MLTLWKMLISLLRSRIHLKKGKFHLREKPTLMYKNFIFLHYFICENCEISHYAFPFAIDANILFHRKQFYQIYKHTTHVHFVNYAEEIQKPVENTIVPHNKNINIFKIWVKLMLHEWNTISTQNSDLVYGLDYFNLFALWLHAWLYTQVIFASI